jgi:hypothetical protein
MCPDTTEEELHKRLQASPTDLRKLVEAGAASEVSGGGNPGEGHRPLATRRPRELEVSA